MSVLLPTCAAYMQPTLATLAQCTAADRLLDQRLEQHSFKALYPVLHPCQTFTLIGRATHSQVLPMPWQYRFSLLSSFGVSCCWHCRFCDLINQYGVCDCCYDHECGALCGLNLQVRHGQGLFWLQAAFPLCSFWKSSNRSRCLGSACSRRVQVHIRHAKMDTEMKLDSSLDTLVKSSGERPPRGGGGGGRGRGRGEKRQRNENGEDTCLTCEGC